MSLEFIFTSDSKDAARQQYASRRRDRQDHGTRGTTRADAWLREAWAQSARKWMLAKQGYIIGPDDGDALDDITDIRHLDYPTSLAYSLTAASDEEYCLSDMNSMLQTMLTTEWTAARILEELEEGKINALQAERQFMLGLSESERERIACLVDAITLGAGMQSDVGPEDSDDLLNHFRSSAALAVRSTIDERPVSELDYMDGFYIQTL